MVQSARIFVVQQFLLNFSAIADAYYCLFLLNCAHWKMPDISAIVRKNKNTVKECWSGISAGHQYLESVLEINTQDTKI